MACRISQTASATLVFSRGFENISRWDGGECVNCTSWRLAPPLLKAAFGILAVGILVMRRRDRAVAYNR